MTVVLKTLDEALDFLETADGSRDWDRLLEPLEFEGNLRRLEVVIKGADFSGEITGEMARALAIYQDAIYSFAKVVLHGNANIPYARLSNEDRKQFQLSISVKDGSTILGIDFKEVLKAAALKLRDMDDETFKRLMVLLAAIAATGFCIFHLGGKALDNANQASQRDHVEEVLKNSVDGQNRQLELLLEHFGKLEGVDTNYPKSVAGALATAQATGITEFAKAAPQAESIEFGAAKLDKEDIATINSRAPRITSEPIDVTARFRVVAETTVGPVTKLTFMGEELPAELTADFIESEFSREQSNAMWRAIRTREPIAVQLRGSFLKGSVRGGVLVDIFDELVGPDEDL